MLIQSHTLIIIDEMRSISDEHQIHSNVMKALESAVTWNPICVIFPKMRLRTETNR